MITCCHVILPVASGIFPYYAFPNVSFKIKSAISLSDELLPRRRESRKCGFHILPDRSDQCLVDNTALAAQRNGDAFVLHASYTDLESCTSWQGTLRKYKAVDCPRIAIRLATSICHLETARIAARPALVSKRA